MKPSLRIPSSRFVRNVFVATSLLLPAVTLPTQAAALFWSFQTLPDGTTGASTLAVTVNDGFSGTNTISLLAGTGSATSASTGGQTSYVYQGVTYTAAVPSGGSASRSLGAQASTGQSLEGAGFQLSLDTTGIEDLGVSFSVRSITQSTTTAAAPRTFASISYSVDGGANFIDLDSGLVSAFTWTSSTNYSRSSTLDLSSISEIENVSNVLLRFQLANTKVDPVANTGIVSFRIDNLEVATIPEPSTCVLFAGAGVIGLVFLRRRHIRA